MTESPTDKACAEPYSPCGLVAAHINLDALRANWRLLVSLSENALPMGVVKADAYGHGIEKVARVLLSEGCRTFAVGSVDEGVYLRRRLGFDFAPDFAHDAVTILPLMGIMDEREAALAVRYALLPLIHSTRQASLVRAAYSGKNPLPVAVKVDTGMSRLGFGSEQPGEMLSALREGGVLKPVFVLSHLAAADEPKRAGVAMQLARFLKAYALLRENWPDIVPSLANSPGYLEKEKLLAKLPSHHVGRPGFALYGGNPFAGDDRETSGKKLLPVMSVTAPVLAARDLPAGETVSYGRDFTAQKDMRVAVIGAGYADGFSRGLSGRGEVSLRGEKKNILGRVCMQMHIVDVTGMAGVAPGDTAYLLGGEGPGVITMDELAKRWGTIPYEVFCLLGKNPHIYHGSV
ncbi:alanine racemase [Deltaproteobacteria bacterium]|nr:alanine racemase [Deltaproteobacteria bacterium]